MDGGAWAERDDAAVRVVFGWRLGAVPGRRRQLRDTRRDARLVVGGEGREGAPNLMRLAVPALARLHCRRRRVGQR
jgi:hypothetical protein